MRRVIGLIASVIIAMVVTTAPVLAWFSGITTPSPVVEGSYQPYRWKYTVDNAWTWVYINLTWYDGAGLLVGGQTYDFGWQPPGWSTGTVYSYWAYDCSSQGSNGKFRLELYNAGWSQKRYTVQNTC